MTNPELVIDFAKFAAALVDEAHREIGRADCRDAAAVREAIGTAQRRLMHASAVLYQSVGLACGHCAARMNEYTDGRPVTSRIDLDEHGTHHCVTWHPARSHQMNLHRDVATVTVHGGIRKTVFVVAPGVLDAVEVSTTPQPQPHTS